MKQLIFVFSSLRVSCKEKLCLIQLLFSVNNNIIIVNELFEMLT